MWSTVSELGLHVYIGQFCDAVSAVISTCNFLDTSVWGDNAFAISIVFPAVHADNNQVTWIRDLAFSFHEDNTSAASNCKKT